MSQEESIRLLTPVQLKKAIEHFGITVKNISDHTEWSYPTVKKYLALENSSKRLHELFFDDVKTILINHIKALKQLLNYDFD